MCDRWDMCRSPGTGCTTTFHSNAYIARKTKPEVRSCILYNNKFILKLSLKNTRSRIVCSHLFRFAKRANNTSRCCAREKYVYMYILLKKISHQNDANRERVRVNTTASAHIVVTAARWITHTTWTTSSCLRILLQRRYFLYSICARFRVPKYTHMIHLLTQRLQNRILCTFIWRAHAHYVAPYVIDFIFCVYPMTCFHSIRNIVGHFAYSQHNIHANKCTARAYPLFRNLSQTHKHNCTLSWIIFM